MSIFKRSFPVRFFWGERVVVGGGGGAGGGNILFSHLLTLEVKKKVGTREHAFHQRYVRILA